MGIGGGMNFSQLLCTSVKTASYGGEKENSPPFYLLR